LARFLYVAVNKDPREPLDPMRAEFIKYILSKQGQQQVVKDGYLPLTADMVAESLELLGLK
jgi:phosphate transport system substrate-binding protein